MSQDERSAVIQVKKKFKTVHQNSKLFRNTDPLRTILMWGVDHSVRDMSMVTIPVVLLGENFKAFRKVKVENSLFCFHNLPSHYTLKEYSPIVFRSLRERFHVTEALYQHCISVAVDSPQTTFDCKRTLLCGGLQVVQVEGDAFIGLSHFLKPYYEYVVERNGDVLILQLMALFRITLNDLKTYFLVTRGLASSNADHHTLNQHSQLHLSIGHTAQSRLLAKLGCDLSFLSSMNIPHCALHVAISPMDGGGLDMPNSNFDGAGVPSLDNKHLYFINLLCFVPLLRKQVKETTDGSPDNRIANLIDDFNRLMV